MLLNYAVWKICPYEVTGSLCLSQASLGIKAGYTLDGVPTHCRAHTLTHYGKFRDTNQPTMHVFGPGKETGVPGGNPQGMGRTCKLHTHTRQRQKSNPQPWRCEANVQATMPPNNKSLEHKILE
ncbi:hypothetical protein QTP86_027629 [Hemibagrus guttatus]|nr:hypothetical protein QTP86_027629 [Hemibagrus guttatus]